MQGVAWDDAPDWMESPEPCTWFGRKLFLLHDNQREGSLPLEVLQPGGSMEADAGNGRSQEGPVNEVAP